MNWFNLNFICDGLSIFMAVVSTSIGILVGIYSIGYMRDWKHKLEYYFLITLFILSMIGLVFSGNLVLMYIFWEITAICSWRLIGFSREEEHLKRADKAFIITYFGSVLMLVGFAIIYSQYNTLDLNNLKNKPIATLPMILLLLGMFAKSAQLPLQIWLPDAGVAPTPVTALLHAAVLVKIGVYAFVRIFNFTFMFPQDTGILNIIISVVIISILASAGAALVENDIKRILAYSTISQIGYILLGFLMNNAMGIIGGLFFILTHGIGKAGLFLSAGVVESNTHIKDIRKLGGLHKNMPVTSMSYLLSALSIIGIPPFSGFFAKLMIIISIVQNGYYIVAILAIFGAVLTMLYLFRLYNCVFLGEQVFSDLKEKTVSMIGVIAVLGILSLILGIIVNIPVDYISKIVGK